MDMSYKKITMTHSSLRSSELFSNYTVFNILGIASKNGNLLTLKPLALWELMETKAIK